MATKRYYWLKLHETFFDEIVQKKMRKQKNGCEMQVIFLKMMLKSLKNDGYIYYQGVYDTIEEEIAEELNEETEIVKETMQYLIKNRLVEKDEESNCFIHLVKELVSSEGYSAERMRKCRERKKVSQCDNDVTPTNHDVMLSDEEKEIEIEKEIEKEIDTEIDTEIEKRERDRVDYDGVVNAYHTYCPSFPRVNVLSDARKKAIKARLNCYSENDLINAFEKVESSDFLKGKNDRNWQANFDWIIKDSNLAKIIDGNYDNRVKNYNSRLDVVDEWAQSTVGGTANDTSGIFPFG